LLDTLLQKLGGSLWKVHVDDLRDNTYVGTVFVRQGDRVIEVDARPSDAIALALGNKVPIFVSSSVASSAGLKKKDLEKHPDGVLRIPAGQKEPLSL
jgi:bifunctional DNase/RNase